MPNSRCWLSTNSECVFQTWQLYVNLFMTSPVILWRLVMRYVEFGASVWRDLSPGFLDGMGSSECFGIPHADWISLVHWFKRVKQDVQTQINAGFMLQFTDFWVDILWCLYGLSGETSPSQRILTKHASSCIMYPKSILCIKLVPEW